jgi:hypothetical protein
MVATPSLHSSLSECLYPEADDIIREASIVLLSFIQAD